MFRIRFIRELVTVIFLIPKKKNIISIYIYSHIIRIANLDHFVFLLFSHFHDWPAELKKKKN